MSAPDFWHIYHSIYTIQGKNVTSHMLCGMQQADFRTYFGSALHSLCECDFAHRESQIVENVFVTLVAC